MAGVICGSIVILGSIVGEVEKVPESGSNGDCANASLLSRVVIGHPIDKSCCRLGIIQWKLETDLVARIGFCCQPANFGLLRGAMEYSLEPIFSE